MLFKKILMEATGQAVRFEWQANNIGKWIGRRSIGWLLSSKLL